MFSVPSAPSSKSAWGIARDYRLFRVCDAIAHVCEHLHPLFLPGFNANAQSRFHNLKTREHRASESPHVGPAPTGSPARWQTCSESRGSPSCGVHLSSSTNGRLTADTEGNHGSSPALPGMWCVHRFTRQLEHMRQARPYTSARATPRICAFEHVDCL